MSAQSIPNHESDQISDIKDGPGRRLRGTRQARGLDIEAIANQLHLKPAAIIALEQEDYDALPGPVFVTGYMRNYARLLGLDPEPLLDAFRATHSQSEPPRPRVARAPKQQVGSGHLAVRLVSFAIIAAVAGLAYVWWQNQDLSGELSFGSAEPEAIEGPITPALEQPAQVVESLAPPPGASAKAELEPINPPPETAVEPATGSSAEAEVSGTVDEPAPQMQTAAVEDTPQEPAVEEAAPGKNGGAAAGEIVLQFNGTSWVDIRDQERNYKLFGEMKKGDRHVLDGTPPYSVIIGNASAVDITIAGAPFDLNAIAKGNVARFKLDPNQLP